jgi:hypothetical protein
MKSAISRTGRALIIIASPSIAIDGSGGHRNVHSRDPDPEALHEKPQRGLHSGHIIINLESEMLFEHQSNHNVSPGNE